MEIMQESGHVAACIQHMRPAIASVRSAAHNLNLNSRKGRREYYKAVDFLVDSMADKDNRNIFKEIPNLITYIRPFL